MSVVRRSSDVAWDAIGKLMIDHLKSRHPWISPRTLWVFLRRRIADQLSRPAEADAGYKTTSNERVENVRLDTLPHRGTRTWDGKHQLVEAFSTNQA